MSTDGLLGRLRSAVGEGSGMHCEHDMCLCLVDTAEEICSDHCREMAGLAGHRDACRCGHGPCARAS